MKTRLTAIAALLSAIAASGATLTWTNGAGDGAWANRANWAQDGVAATALPGDGDAVVFPAAGAPWQVALPSNATATNVVADGAVTFSGGGRLTCSGFSGAGALTLAGATLRAAGADLVISNDVEIASGTTNYVKLANGGYWNCHIYGDMSGAGYIDVQISKDRGQDRGMKFHGDNTAFAGTFASSIYYARNGIAFDSAACASANAVWIFDNNSPKPASQPLAALLFTSTTDTYRFGAFVGEMRSGAGSRIVEFGGRGDVETIAKLINRHDQNGRRQGGFRVTKVGWGPATFLTGTLNGSPDTDAIETLDIQGGSVLLAAAAQMQALSFTGAGGILGIAGNISLDPSSYIKNSTAPICFRNIEGEVHSWATALDASNTGGLLKLGEGRLELLEIPQYSGPTRVLEGTLVVPPGTELTDVYIGAGAAITYTTGEPTPWMVPAGPKTLTWTNASGDGAWENSANWAISGSFALATPGPDDTVVFPADGAPWDVTLAAAATVTNFVASGAVTLSGALIYTEKVDGGATITLAGNAGFHTVNNNKDVVLEIPNNIVVTGPGNKFETYGSKSYMEGGRIRILGSVSGDGEISLKGKRSIFELHGRWLDFAGTVNVVNDGIPRNGTQIHSHVATSPNAVWNIYSSSDDCLLRYASRRYYFGALNGAIYQPKNIYNNWLEIGGLGIDCSFGGKLGGSSQNHIDKVGPARLTFTGSDLGNLEIHEGTFVFGGHNSMTHGEIRFTGAGLFAVCAVDETTGGFIDPSPHLKNSVDLPICFSNSVGEVHVWQTALDASNTGGLVKKGEGALILAEPPQYTGETTVEGGVVVVSNATAIAIAPGAATCISYDADGTAFLTPPPPSAVAMLGSVAYESIAEAVAACLADPANNVLILLDGEAGPLYIPFGSTILVRSSGGVEPEFATDDECRIDKSPVDAARGIYSYSHVLDVVNVAEPAIANATLTAATNGVTLAARNGVFGVLRGTRVDFTWRPDDGYTLNFDASALVAGDAENALAADELPFAMRAADIISGDNGDGTILRIQDIPGVDAFVVEAPSALATLSVETSASLCSIALPDTLRVENIVFTPGATLRLLPGPALGDGDTLISWAKARTADAFVLSEAALAAGWRLRASADGLRLYKISGCLVGGVAHPTVAEALAASSDGDTLTLVGDTWIFERLDVPPGETRTLDLAGNTLKVASIWAANVGDAALCVSNGSVVCSRYGFYVTSGSLYLANCEIESTGRVAQVCGPGKIDVAPDAALSVSGDDPAIFAIGGAAGKASVVSAGGTRSGSYDIAGNSSDVFGADFALSGAKSINISMAIGECLYHPDGQGGDVAISGGWFSSRPRDEWLAPDLTTREEVLLGLSGWRVFYCGADPFPAVSDPGDLPTILAGASDAARLIENIDSIEEYNNFIAWANSRAATRSSDTLCALLKSNFAWPAFALDAPALIYREEITPDDIEISDFAASPDAGLFSLDVGIKDVAIGDDADVSRLVRTLGLEGADTFDFDRFDPSSVTIGLAAPHDGKVRLTARPISPSPRSFFMRVRLK